MNITNMKAFAGIQYLAIDVANYAGHDKLTFEERIQWVQDNFSTLETLEVEEDPILYKKAVMSLKRACRGEAIGHIVYLDACCSGIQIMSALSGCKDGAHITGLIDPDKRMDAYKFITDTMNVILVNMGIEGIEVARKDAKDAIMPCTYGSEAKPIEYFGEGKILEAFYKACHKEAGGAFELLEVLKATWQSGALAHSWKLPDGFQAHVKVYKKVEKRMNIEELFNYTMTVQYKEYVGKYKGVSNVANVIHSIDAFLLREIIRRCNYNKPMFTKVFHVIKDHIANGTSVPLVSEELKYYFNQADRNAICSVVVVPYINSGNVAELPKAYLADLLVLMEQMLSYEPFEVTTVHDAFGAHANNCDVLRHWYREMLAELADSDVIQHIIRQITGDQSYIYHKRSQGLSESIRKSNYAIC